MESTIERQTSPPTSEITLPPDVNQKENQDHISPVLAPKKHEPLEDDFSTVVRFRSLEKPKEDEFSIKLSSLEPYDRVVETVVSRLNLEGQFQIRLTSHDFYSQQPKPVPISCCGSIHLFGMLGRSDILYYEVFDIPSPKHPDINIKTLKVAFHHATKDEVVKHTISLPKQSTVGDLIKDLKTKVELSHPSAELRLLKVFCHKIYHIFLLDEKIENITDRFWMIRAEEIPEEEKTIGPHDRLIHVSHFDKETFPYIYRSSRFKGKSYQQVNNFGEPFLMLIREGETFADVKMRIQKKLKVPDDEFSKWKFAFVLFNRPEDLQDSDIVSTRFQAENVSGICEHYIGLEHPDNSLDGCSKRLKVVDETFSLFTFLSR